MGYSHLKEAGHKPSMVTHLSNPNTQEAEAGGLPGVQDQPGVHSKTPISNKQKEYGQVS